LMSQAISKVHEKSDHLSLGMVFSCDDSDYRIDD
jgi:hypothetical protein